MDGKAQNMVEVKALDAKRRKKSRVAANWVEPASEEPLSVEGTVFNGGDPRPGGVFGDLGVPEGELAGVAAVKLR